MRTRAFAGFSETNTSQFLERFRYTIVASNLLDEILEQTARSAKPEEDDLQALQKNVARPSEHVNLHGAVLVGVVAMLVVLPIAFLRNVHLTIFNLVCCLLMLGLLIAPCAVIWEQHVVQFQQAQVLNAATTMVSALCMYERSFASAFGLIQEVELLSRGYHFAAAPPPVSRLDDSKAARKCSALRGAMRKMLHEGDDLFLEKITALKTHIYEDDLEKYLDVYDLPRDACLNAAMTHVPDSDESESLTALRIAADRRALLRRCFLCMLLALSTDGTIRVASSLRRVSAAMADVGVQSEAHVSCLNGLLHDLSDFTSRPDAAAPARSSDRLKSQLRQIGSLSQGIRSIHAKMVLMREESQQVIEQSQDLIDLGPALLNQYESIGADLRSVMRDWEAGKQSLSANLERHDRRMSRNSIMSNGLLSPASSLGGSTAVSDRDGATGSHSSDGPADALRALTGRLHDALDADMDDQEQELIFEAVAMPRNRSGPVSTLSRAERIAKAAQDRTQQARVEQVRQSGANVIRELQSVINLRKGPSVKDSPAPSSVSVCSPRSSREVSASDVNMMMESNSEEAIRKRIAQSRRRTSCSLQSL